MDVTGEKVVIIVKLQNSLTVEIMLKLNNISALIAPFLHTLWHRASPNEWHYSYMASVVSTGKQKRRHIKNLIDVNIFR